MQTRGLKNGRNRICFNLHKAMTSSTLVHQCRVETLLLRKCASEIEEEEEERKKGRKKERKKKASAEGF
jgi:hypothetical protein